MIPDLSSNPYSLFEQMANISKAHAYDIVVEQVKELKEINTELIDIGSTILAIMALEKVERYDIAKRLKDAILKANKPPTLKTN